MSGLEWQWPLTGPTPVSYGLDGEIFDSEKFPHLQTFVREAVQNSLDARDDRSRPVTVRFMFHEAAIGSRRRFLANLQAHKAECGLEWPEAWNNGRISWLVVEDSNSTGLRGDLAKRQSDFWNYWMNFGISNKNGSGRGGRGIGRVTFLIASAISTVIGVTKRSEDGVVAACGMSVMKPVPKSNDFRSSYAYLSPTSNGAIYELYSSSTFHADLSAAFDAEDHGSTGENGLSLIIPYPHETLSADGILAAAIEHFAPAVLSGQLVVEADRQVLDGSTIDKQAQRVAEHFPAGPIREDPVRMLDLIRFSATAPVLVIDVPSLPAKLGSLLKGEEIERLREKLAAGEPMAVAVEVPVSRHGKTVRSRMDIAVAATPDGRKPLDLFYREGMCLPEVASRVPADVDTIVQARESELATYLNFCEGKAHLGLIENKEVTAKLREQGFTQGYTLKRFVRQLADDLRVLVLPDASRPDASLFSQFFSIAKPEPKPGSKDGNGAKVPKPQAPVPPPPPPPAQPRIFFIDDLPDGFRIRANKDYKNWPLNVRAEIAYADGSRRPAWSRHDFEVSRLGIEQHGDAKLEAKGNVIVCRGCGSDFSLAVTGFDARRELVTTIRSFTNA